MHKRTLRFLCSTSILAAVAIPPVAQADHSWGSYHWGRTSNPFTLKVGNNVSSVWQSSFNSMIADWTKSTVVDLQAVPGNVSNRRKCAPTLGRIEVCNYAYGRNGWLGIAQIWASGNHITQSVVKMNDTYYGTATYNKPEWRNMVMCQEVGHGLGLDHQDEAFDNPNLGTCMDYTSSPLGPPNNEHPNTHDYDMLKSIYAHVDAAGTVFSTPPSEAGGNAPEEWGKLLRTRHGGRIQVFERELGGGHRIFTFVIWAEERGNRHH